MKKFLTAIAKRSTVIAMLLVLVFSPFMQLVSVAQAQTLTSQPTSFTNYTAPTTGATSPAATQTTNTGSITNIQSVNASIGDSQGASSPAASAATGGSQPSATTPSDDMCVGGIGGCLANIIYVFTAGIGSAFAYVAAIFFNIAINLSLNGPIYALTFVSTGWTTARDLANMGFLFILIYIAFIVMFQAETSGTMSLLAGVVVIALLVNFSFFFTRLVIDVGNILSIQFYNSIPAPAVTTTAASGGAIVGGVATAANYVTNATAGVTGAHTKDLTAGIMGMLNVQGLVNNQSFQNFTQQKGWLSTFIALSFLYLAMGIIFWLLTIIFVTAGVKFLTRIVILWFLIIVSPLAFIAASVQGINKGYFKRWREMLVSESVYPVAFMFIFLILTNFCNQLSAGGTGSGNSYISDLFANLNGVPNGGIAAIAITIAQAAISLGFIITILYMGLKVSDRISVAGASYAEKAGNWAGRFARNTMTAGPGLFYRNTVAAGANKIDTALKNTGWANTTGTFGGVLGYRLRKNVLEPARATSLGTGVATFKEREDYLKKRSADMDTNKRTVENKKDIEWMTSNSSAYTAAKKKAAALRTANEQTLVDEGDRVKTRMKGLGKKDFDSVKFADIKSMISVITESQLKTIKDGDKLNEKEKEDLTIEWNTHNPASAYQKAHKEVDELRTIAAELHRVGITLTKVDTHIGGVTTAARSNALVDKDVVKEMYKDAKRQMAVLDNKIATDNRAGLDTTDARENKDKLKEAIDHIEKLKTETGNVQANIGGEKEEGKFRTK